MKQRLQPVKLSHALLLISLLQCLVWSIGVVEESSQQYYLLQNEFLAKGHLNLVSAEELSNYVHHLQRLATLALLEQQEGWVAQLSLLQQRSLELRNDHLGPLNGQSRLVQQDFLFKSLQHVGRSDDDDDDAAAVISTSIRSL